MGTQNDGLCCLWFKCVVVRHEISFSWICPRLTNRVQAGLDMSEVIYLEVTSLLAESIILWSAGCKRLVL